VRFVLLLFTFWTAGACGRVVEETIELQATVMNMYGKAVTHPFKVTVFRDDARPRSPFLVLNHGRAYKPEEFAKMGRVRYTDNSHYFVAQGFAVFVPTRIGYGVSGGEDVEYTGSCQNRNNPGAGFEAAAQQSVVVIEYARARPYVDPERGIAAGQSYGGATSIALAARNLPGVVAAVNFAGGGGGNPATNPGRPCRPEQLEAMFAAYGVQARIPTLWLYSENDRYFGVKLPREWFDAFRAKGGAGEFVQLPPLDPALGDDGHATFTRNPPAWRPHFEAFVRKAGF
jgi:dienelactone hydrolase